MGGKAAFSGRNGSENAGGGGAEAYPGSGGGGRF